MLEAEQDREAKNERTRQLLAAYKKKVGLNVDPKLRSECEKVLKILSNHSSCLRRKCAPFLKQASLHVSNISYIYCFKLDYKCPKDHSPELVFRNYRHWRMATR